VKQTTNLDKFANTGNPAAIFKIAFAYKKKLQWVKYYEDRDLFDKVVAHYKGPHGYAGTIETIRIDFLKMDFLGGELGWYPAHEPFIHEKTSAPACTTPTSTSG